MPKFAPLLRAGWEVIPLDHAGEKRPLVEGYHGADHEVADEATVRAWAKAFPACNPAIVLPYGIIGLDVDSHTEDADGLLALEAFQEAHGALPDGPRIFHGYSDTGQPSQYGTRLFRVPDEVLGEYGPRKVVGNLNKVSGRGVDVISWWIRYNVAPGAIHSSGQPYEWAIGDHVLSITPTPDDVPMLSVEQAEALLRVNVKKAKQPDSHGVKSIVSAGPIGAKPLVSATTPMTYAERGNMLLRQVKELAALPDGERLLIEGEMRGWQEGSGFYTLACALLRVCAETGTDVEKIKRRFLKAAAAAEDEGHDVEREWDNAVESTEDDVEEIVARNAPDADDVRFRDALLVERVAQELNVPLVFTKAFGWMEWTGVVWSPITEERVTEVVRVHIVEWFRQAIGNASSDAERAGLKSLLSKGKIKAVVDLLKGVLSKDAEVFDRSPDYLNCRNGVVDLRTGDLLEHSPEFLMTKVAGCNYVPGARHPDWEKAKSALEPEVREYLLARLGQAATGHTPPDDKIIFDIGPGGNGKSTFLEPCRRALGDFAGMVPQKLLLANPNDHPTEFMALRGLRLAICEELPEGGRLNTQRLKTIAGTESITARNVFKDNVSFEPTHGLFVNTNHAPQVVETDHGTWRRLEMVAFDRKFRATDGSIDKTLRQRVKHRAVVEAALAELVQHAIRWYKDGQVMPDPPASVAKATTEWRGDSDDLFMFFHERLEADLNGGCVALSDLLYEFNLWLVDKNRTQWGDRLLTTRLATNETLPVKFEKVRTRRVVKPSGRVVDEDNPIAAWRGVTWQR